MIIITVETSAYCLLNVCLEMFAFINHLMVSELTNVLFVCLLVTNWCYFLL